MRLILLLALIWSTADARRLAAACGGVGVGGAISGDGSNSGGGGGGGSGGGGRCSCDAVSDNKLCDDISVEV
jgi:hypothetical protein